MASCNSCSAPNPADMCPSRMADGRAFTDYGGMCSAHSLIMKTVNPKGVALSSYESRMYLQRNAEQFMKMEFDRSVARMAPCAPCKRPNSDPGTMLPERYVYRCDGVSCAKTEVNPYGLGDGRQFNFQ